MGSAIRTLSLASRGIGNYLTNRPLSVSFEVTYSCNARCKHCHLGGFIKDEVKAPPERFGELCQQIKPVVAQISGGEPLIRRDLEDIVRAMRRKNRAPYIVVTTNAIMLNKKRYESLIDAGVDQFSISLDYPDERHDEFRGHKGLFQHIDKLIRELKGSNGKCITLSCVVQKDNFRDLITIAELSEKWGVNVNFSTYTWLRTNDMNYVLDADDLLEFKEIVKKLLAMRKKYHNFFASEYTFKRMIEFYEKKSIPNCRAGERFFIVNPDGRFSPCGLILTYHDSMEEMKKDFVKKNTCTACNTSIRSNCEKPVKYLIKDNLATL
ncbi:MAG: radical SAM protein [Calditrichaeota bacterium]|nr:radical SAM protein [Calditrichota bacterium]